MAQSSQALMLQEGIGSYYDSLKFTDVKILITPRGFCGPGKGPTIRVPAHKIILAAGSGAFRDYFKTHNQESTICLGDIYRVTDDVATSVLRHLYGHNIFKKGIGVCYDCKNLCDAADGFGIPSLRKHTIENLEERLHGLLKEGFTTDDPDDTNIERFVDAIQAMDWDENGDSEIIQVVAKLSCMYFTKLQEHSTFNEFTNDCPEFSRTVLEYAARKGLLNPR